VGRARMYKNHVPSAVRISTEAARLTTLRSLLSVYEVDPVTGGPTAKQRQKKSCIFRVVPS
jgi:hypothetical protein